MTHFLQSLMRSLKHVWPSVTRSDVAGVMKDMAEVTPGERETARAAVQEALSSKGSVDDSSPSPLGHVDSRLSD